MKPKFENTKFILFMSVDLVGSTSFKLQVPPPGLDSWYYTFGEFYEDFPKQVLFKKIEKINREVKGHNCDPPELWKTLGDELIFKVEVKHHMEVKKHIKAFLYSVKEQRNIYKEKPLPLSIKATAWIAEFPVYNAIVQLNDRQDYIGPSMDIGFRLCKYSDERKFVLSIDLACLIAHNENKLTFHYDGGTDLKGISLPRKYPLIWLDTYDDNDDNDKLYKRFPQDSSLIGREPVDPGKIEDYCNHYIDKKSNENIIIPFFKNDPDFSEPPQNYDDIFEQIKPSSTDDAESMEKIPEDKETELKEEYQELIEKNIPKPKIKLKRKKKN